MTPKRKFPANTWEVVVEVRLQGAQGNFYPMTRTIRAEERDIARFVSEDCGLDELEVRFITSKRRLA